MLLGRSCCGDAAARSIMVDLRFEELAAPDQRSLCWQQSKILGGSHASPPACRHRRYLRPYISARNPSTGAGCGCGSDGTRQFGSMKPSMEGVLVSATRAGSNITVTVVTGADGRYAFPANRLAPGQYTLAVRAVGYELDQPRKVEIGATVSTGPTVTTGDLKLGKTRDLAAQLSNGEWLASIPGTDQAEGSIAQLRRLPPGRAHHALEIRRRRFPHPDPAAHAGLRAAEPADPSAIAPRRAADGGAGRRPDRGLSRRGAVSEHDQSRHNRPMEICAEDAAASEGRSDAGDLYRIRPAARGNGAARYDRRQRRHRLVLQASASKSSASSTQKPARSPNFPILRTATMPRPAALDCAPTARAICGSATCTRRPSSSSIRRRRNFSSGRCRPKRTSPRRRSTW